MAVSNRIFLTIRVGRRSSLLGTVLPSVAIQNAPGPTDRFFLFKIAARGVLNVVPGVVVPIGGRPCC